MPDQPRSDRLPAGKLLAGMALACVLLTGHAVGAPLEERAFNPEAAPQDTITPNDEVALRKEVLGNIERLQLDSRRDALGLVAPVLLSWPVQLAPGHRDYAGFYVSAFTDDDSASITYKDYNGGNRTYDSHRGTDIALWPFRWNKVDAGEVGVIAAADGTIVGRNDTVVFDRNCVTGDAANGLGNYIVLLHADGRSSIYGHMKYQSVTAKGINATVVRGEYLGLVGSSGNSSGPHVHFEVRNSTFNSATWFDPFSGPLGSTVSAWQSQRPYYDSAINALATGTAGYVDGGCNASVTNFQDAFVTPVTIYFQVYFRDYQNALPTVFTILDPAGQVYQTWSYTHPSQTFAKTLAYDAAFAFADGVVPGVWKFQAQYNGQLYEARFTVNKDLVITVPEAPVIGLATASHRSVSVSFQPPFSDGGAPIDQYRATCGGATALGANSPLAVGGLRNGPTYQCTVAAHNQVGWSVESLLSNPVRWPGGLSSILLLLE